ncbi:taste receptor type 1 member 1 [Rhinophrynus dorsalis]
MSGDYIIAGLFQLHQANVLPASVPQIDSCDSAHFNSLGYHLLQAMRYSIEEINNSTTLLPNVTLGYEIFDTCSDAATIYGTLKTLSQHSDSHIRMQNDFTEYNTRAIALIGPSSSNFAFITASVLGMFLVPQISYSASNELLSLKDMYPSFLRMIPSDKLQVEAMLHLLLRFKWTWIAVVGSDDVYGRYGLQNLYTLLTNNGICVAYQGIIPYTTDGTEVRQMLQNIMQTRVKVIVVFAAYLNARIFFKEVVNANITEIIWIGSESWSCDLQIVSIPNIESIGSVLGISVDKNDLPGLLDFEVAYLNSLREDDKYLYGCNQVCQECQTLTPHNMTMPSNSFSVYSAAYAIAHGLHNLLNCTSGTCSKDTFYPWQLLQEVKKVNFSLYNQTINFDDKGDPAIGYDIVMWDWSGDNPIVNVIGSFSQNPRRLELSKVLLWHTQDNSVPESICSKECGKGERRVQTGSHVCCFECISCPEMTFLNKRDLYACQSCEYHQWSPPRSEICYNRTLEYLSWTEPISIVFLLSITLLLILIFAIAVIFTVNLSTPVVKSAGGKMCLLMLISLAFSCCTLYCYFGKPTAIVCMIRQPIFTISYTVCFSCIVVHSFQIVCIFKMATHMPKIYNMWVKNNGSNIFIIVSSVGQVLISIIWIVLKPPEPIEDYSLYREEIIFKCSESISVSSIVGIVYIGILSMLCFIFCYMGKDLPDNYNEAKCISFSLLVYIFSWIAFFTTHIMYKGKYIVAVNVAAILASIFGILAGYFTPKCFIILFRPELNTMDHFKTAIQNYTKKQSSQ